MDEHGKYIKKIPIIIAILSFTSGIFVGNNSRIYRSIYNTHITIINIMAEV